MKSVFVLQHEHEWCGRDEVKFIGAYATHAEAEAAIERLRAQPGFCYRPEGFAIDEYELGKDHWDDGFIVMSQILLPSLANPGHFQFAGAHWMPGDLYQIADDAEGTDYAVGDIVRCVEKSVPGHGHAALVVSERVSAD